MCSWNHCNASALRQLSSGRPQQGDWGPETIATSVSSELNQNHGSMVAECQVCKQLTKPPSRANVCKVGGLCVLPVLPARPRRPNAICCNGYIALHRWPGFNLATLASAVEPHPGLVLLQDLTWRNSMRPLFVAVGLEDVADDIRRWTKATPCQTALCFSFSHFRTAGQLCCPAGFGNSYTNLHSAWRKWQAEAWKRTQLGRQQCHRSRASGYPQRSTK